MKELDRGSLPLRLRRFQNLCDITDEMDRTGIYFLCRDGLLEYIGQSVHVGSRGRAHFREQEIKNRQQYDTMLYIPCLQEQLLSAEGAFIRKLEPRCNSRRPRHYKTDPSPFRVDEDGHIITVDADEGLVREIGGVSQ